MHFYLDIQDGKRLTCIRCGDTLVAETKKGVFHCPTCVPNLNFKVTERKTKPITKES